MLEYYTFGLSHSLNVDDKVEVEVVPPDCALNVVVRTGKKKFISMTVDVWKVLKMI